MINGIPAKTIVALIVLSSIGYAIKNGKVLNIKTGLTVSV